MDGRTSDKSNQTQAAKSESKEKKMSAIPKTEGDKEILIPTEYTPQKKRWYILFLTGLIGGVQSLIWMGWGTIAQSMYFAYPTWNDGDIGLLGNWGEICFLIFAIPASSLLTPTEPG